MALLWACDALFFRSWLLPVLLLLALSQAAGEGMKVQGMHASFMIFGVPALELLGRYVPSLCCLGGAALLLTVNCKDGKQERPRKQKVTFDESPKKAQSPVNVEKVVTPEDEESLASMLSDTRKSAMRSCFFCGFLEDWMLPADSSTADAVEPLSASEVPVFTADEQKKLELIAKLRFGLLDLFSDKEAVKTVEAFGGETCMFNRFLQATRWNVEQADKKIRSTVEWRRSVGANSVSQSSECGRVWELMKPHWPEKLIGTTKAGNPVTYFDLSQAVRICQMDIWTEANVQNFYVSFMEQSLKLQREGREKCGPQGDCNNMPSSVVVYNLKGLRFSDCLKCVSGLKALAKILGIIDEHYPENLHQAVIINVPCLFYKAVWPIVQKALDARTLSNILLSDGEGRDLISKVLGISEPQAQTLLEGVFVDGSATPPIALA